MGIIRSRLAVPASMFAQKKEDDRLAKSAAAIREILEGEDGLPRVSSIKPFVFLFYPSRQRKSP